MTNIFNSPASYEVIHRLEQAGYEAVFVGGAVRDYLLHKTAKDIDIATSAEPYEVKAIFSNTIDIGIAHGTVLVVLDHETIEVTTYRTEGTYTDHRRPDKVHFVKTLHDDLLRRDFTINALAMNKNGKVIDLFNGEKDLSDRIIRAVGDPNERFHEDALRMLRAIRFSSVLDFDIEASTLSAIDHNAYQINNVSVERIKIELDKLFIGKNPAKALITLFSSPLGKELSLYTKQVEELKRSLPFNTSTEGWAFFATIGEVSPSELVAKFKLSNTERKFIHAVHEAYTKRIKNPFTTLDYYVYSMQVLLCAEKFFRATHSEAESITNLEMERRKNSLPIHSKQDLVVNGQHLLQWTRQPGGPWTGEWMKKIELAVLYGESENTLAAIKDWFTIEFKCEK